MANIDRVASVQISLNTTGISTAGFSTLLVVGHHPYSLSRVVAYTSIEDMINDGFTANDALYKMVNDGFGQTPRPRLIKVGRRQVDNVIVALKSIGTKSTYSITISKKNADSSVNKQVYSYENNGATAEAILTALKTAITADASSPVTATVVGSTLSLVNKNPGEAFTIKVSSLLEVSWKTDVTESIAESMAAIKASDNDWYGIALDSRKQADILAMADWAESQIKIFGTAISEAGAKDQDSIIDTGHKLFEKNYYRTHWWYHADAEIDFPEVAVMTRCFAIDPGGETWALKKLAGVSTDNLTESEYQTITNKNGNTFERFRNVAITQNGKVAAGEYIDVIRFRDWLQEEMTTRIFNILINRNKVSYTDNGINVIETQMKAALKYGQEKGGIASTEYDEDGNENLGYTVTVPLSSNISANQKASRILKDCFFTARLAGAIHVVEIKGGLTYENLIK